MHPGGREPSPARFLCGGVLWLTDVTLENNPLHDRPGSHLLIARHAEGHQQTPPDLGYEPLEPVLARAGQSSLFGGPVVHAGSVSRSPDLERIASFIEQGATEADFASCPQEREAAWGADEEHWQPPR